MTRAAPVADPISDIGLSLKSATMTLILAASTVESARLIAQRRHG